MGTTDRTRNRRPRRSKRSKTAACSRRLRTITRSWRTPSPRIRPLRDRSAAIELQSAATPAQYLALRDDSRAITLAASSATGLSPKTASNRSLAVSVQIDRSLLYGSFSDQAWAQEKTRLEQNLAGTNVPQSLIDRTIADERATANSTGVTSDEYQTFNDDYNRTRQDAKRVPAGYGHFPDPLLSTRNTYAGSSEAGPSSGRPTRPV